MNKAGMMRTITLLLSVCFFFSAQAQKKKRRRIKSWSKQTVLQKTDQGELVKLYGKVKFKHDGATMYCDSAHFFKSKNYFDAYSNVRVTQGDSVDMYCDSLHYNGTTKMLNAKGNVKFVEGNMTLTTPTVDYNRQTGSMIYTQGGYITDEDKNLFSKIGSYNSSSKWFTFRDSVRLTSDKYVIVSDTMLYHNGLGIARFRGPSTIKMPDGYIECVYGDYDLNNEIANFSRGCKIVDQATTLIGDSIYYVKNKGIGDMYGDVYMRDSIQNFVITGQHAFYKEDPEFAMVTGDPLYSMIDDQNDSLHIHGDTLRINTNKEGKRLVRVYNNTKFFKSDFQGKCDSLTFDEGDSTLRMFVNPVLWNGDAQLTANDIYMTLRNGQLDSIFMIKNAFILSKVDSIKYDQVRGKNIKGRFRDSELRSLHVIGNGQTVYTVVDDSVQQGINRADCSDIIVRFLNSDISEIVFLTKPNAKMYPLGEIPDGELFLRGFNSRIAEKPKSKNDLFLD